MSVRFKFVNAAEVSKIKPGMIMFLPPRSELPKDIITTFDINEGAFNHPITIISCPSPNDIKHTSVVQIAIVSLLFPTTSQTLPYRRWMTSFNGTAIKKHLASKGISKETGAQAAALSEYLRVVTVSKPFARDALKLRNGKGMKRDFSYIEIEKTYGIEVRALANYAGLREGVDTYCLTAHATKKVIAAINVHDMKERNRKKKALLTTTDSESQNQTKGSDDVPLRRVISIQEKSSSTTPIFKPMDWRENGSSEDAEDTPDLMLSVSPRSGLRPCYQAMDDWIVVPPRRLTSQNPYRVLKSDE